MTLRRDRLKMRIKNGTYDPNAPRVRKAPPENKLQPLKKQWEYSIEQIDKIKELLEKDPNMHAQDMSLEVGLSARQIKLVRHIFKKGSEEDIKRLYSHDFRIASIKLDINYQKEKIKKAERIEKLKAEGKYIEPSKRKKFVPKKMKK